MKNSPHLLSRQRGTRTIAAARAFTLIELMVVVALMSIMVSLAMPSFTDMLNRYRTHGRLNSMEASLALARHEAIRRGRDVTIRGVAGLGCDARQWRCGWELVVLDNATPPVFVTIKKEDADTHVFIKPSMTTLGYNAFGQFLGFANVHFDSKEVAPHTTHQMLLCISRAGRVRQQAGATSCS